VPVAFLDPRVSHPERPCRAASILCLCVGAGSRVCPGTRVCEATKLTEPDRGTSGRSGMQQGGGWFDLCRQQRTAQGVSPRTCANELSHLRAVLVQIGKAGLVRSPEYSNQALGISGGSRVGTKQPLSDPDIRAFQNRMVELGRSGVGEILELQRVLGLREAEAIRGGNPDTLARNGAPDWMRTSDLQLRRLPLYPSELRARRFDSTGIYP
jgi:hypothetical protein